jgi:septum formation protein
MRADFVYLASASPRRRELLLQLGLRCEAVPAEIEERPAAGETPADYVLRLAHLKAEAAVRRLGVPPSAVLAADTEVAVDGEVLGKPRDREAGLAMLVRLSGRGHQVFSGVALWSGGKFRSALSESRVWFRAVSPAEAAAYWDTGEPMDKAGGYAIQGRGAIFIERLEGSYSGVMGLPLFETARLLREAGMDVIGGET